MVFADAKAMLLQPESLAVTLAVHHRLFNEALTLTSHTPVFCFAPVKSTSPLSDMLVNSLKMYNLFHVDLMDLFHAIRTSASTSPKTKIRLYGGQKGQKTEALHILQ